MAIGPVARAADAGPGMGPVRQVSARTVCVGESSTRSGAMVVTGAADGFVRRSRSCRAEGRYCASLARAAVTSGRSDSGTAETSGSSCRTRYRTASVGPPPNGDSPEAAYAIVTPQTKMSASGPGLPSTCSGAMNPAEPTIMPVLVTTVASRVWAIPKSMTFGPSAARMTLEGFRSLCTMPAAWITVRASASPVASPYSMSAPSGPCRSTYSASVGPSMNSVTMNGTTDSVSASITRTVHTPLTFVRTDTSRWKRLRNSGSSASSGRSTFTATRPPSAASPRYTTTHAARAQPGRQPVAAYLLGIVGPKRHLSQGIPSRIQWPARGLAHQHSPYDYRSAYGSSHPFCGPSGDGQTAAADTIG